MSKYKPIQIGQPGQLILVKSFMLSNLVTLVPHLVQYTLLQVLPTFVYICTKH